MLKKLPLGPAELAIVKEKAGLLHQGELRRGEAVLPIMLASFIFDILRSSDTESKAKRQAARKLCETTKEDEELGFKAALYAIGKVNKGKLKVIELTPEVRKLLSIAGKITSLLNKLASFCCQYLLHGALCNHVIHIAKKVAR